jgi:hypothetical protein
MPGSPIGRETMTADAGRPATAGSETDECGMPRGHHQAWESFAACAVRLIPVLQAQMKAVTAETERAAMDLLMHLRVLASQDAGATAEEKSASLSKVVMAMQFQDITRQKLEHVGEALDQWSRHLQALMRGPQDEGAQWEIAALEQIEQTYTMEEERRLHAEAVMPEYQEPVPSEVLESEPQSDSVTLF